MPDAKTRTVDSITNAKAELDRAMAELETLRTFDPAVVGLVAHAVSHYITVTTATVEMLQLTLRDNTDPNVAIWLDGIVHAANLMQHFVGRLVEVTAPADFPLKPDYVNLELLIQRSCEYYRRRAAPQGVAITVETTGTMPLVWGDRVALAVVTSNLLANAVHASPPGSTVRVRVAKEPGYVTCAIRDEGSGELPDPQHLALARDFIRRLDGELWSDTEPGRGTNCAFRLPALDE
jgi:two-component system, sensor histidine kinase and response regulator